MYQASFSLSAIAELLVWRICKMQDISFVWNTTLAHSRPSWSTQLIMRQSCWVDQTIDLKSRRSYLSLVIRNITFSEGCCEYKLSLIISTTTGIHTIKDFYSATERVITLVFWHQEGLAGNVPFHLKLHSKWFNPFEKRHLWRYRLIMSDP